MSDGRTAILIQNSRYDAWEGLSPLRCPPKDVAAMDAVLSGKGVGDFETTRLENESSQVILSTIERICRKTQREDVLLIYFSGHGKLIQNNLFLVTTDSSPESPLCSSIPISRLHEQIRHSRARNVILILDCCYSGAGNGDAVRGQLLAGGEQGLFIMTASTSIEVATEKDGDENSVFTKHLLHGLRTGEADVNGDGIITPRELSQYVEDNVPLEAAHRPTHLDLNASPSLVIARCPRRTPDWDRRRNIRRKLQEVRLRQVVPERILDEATSFLDGPNGTSPATQVRFDALLSRLAEDSIPLSEFVEGWMLLDSGLAGVDASAIEIKDRWQSAREARRCVLDLVGPAYLLDNTYHFLDWNPAFDEIIAKPIGLVRGRHAEDFIRRLSNLTEVVERSRLKFTPGHVPLVDMELLELPTEKYGPIVLRKVATQIADNYGATQAWSVALNIESAGDREALWEDIERRLDRDSNWSRYAVSYDKLLLNFDEYAALLSKLVGFLDGTHCCADVGAGTGNGTVQLLRGHPDREVWALEANERMLDFLYEKIRSQGQGHRIGRDVIVLKGDLMVGMREIASDTFDGILLMNALYAVDDPQSCLCEAYRVLAPGGVLALSTSHTGTNLDKLFGALRADLRRKGMFADLRQNVDDAFARNRRMDREIHRDSIEQVVDYVESAGFEITGKPELAYVDAVVTLRAVKV